MGICLSCLRHDDNDDEITEQTPLLNDTLSADDKIEAMRRRQEELDKIVNDTNEQLIDVTTFFSSQPLNTNSTNNGNDGVLSGGLTVKPLNGNLQDDKNLNELQLKAIDNFSEFTDDELHQYNQFNKDISELVKEESKIKPLGPLLVDF